jgi:hypothetical protein
MALLSPFVAARDNGVLPVMSSALNRWSGVEWSGASLHGVHGVVAKGVPIWCQFQRCIDREKHAIHSI